MDADCALRFGIVLCVWRYLDLFYDQESLVDFWFDCLSPLPTPALRHHIDITHSLELYLNNQSIIIFIIIIIIAFIINLQTFSMAYLIFRRLRVSGRQAGLGRAGTVGLNIEYI